MNKQRITLFLDGELIKRARAAALKENKSLSDLVEQTLDVHLPRFVAIVQPTAVASDVDKLGLNQAEQLISNYNAGTAGLPTIQPNGPQNTLGAVTDSGVKIK